MLFQKPFRALNVKGKHFSPSSFNRLQRIRCFATENRLLSIAMKLHSTSPAILFFLILLLPFLVFACTSSQTATDVVRKPEKQHTKVYFGKTPPNTVWLRDNLYMDKTEISNFSYSEMIWWHQMRQEEDPKRMQFVTPRGIHQDSLFSNIPNGTQEHYTFYLLHPSFRNHPVVNLTHEQAAYYCRWRTDRVNFYLAVKNKEVDRDTMLNYRENYNSLKTRVHFRLPTKEEWMYAAQAGLDPEKYPLGFEAFYTTEHFPASVTQEYNNIYRPQVSNDSIVQWSPDWAAPTTSVFEGKPNGFGILNMVGNVRELVDEPGLAMGISYHDYLERYAVSQSTAVELPSYQVGFRCVCEVLTR